MKYYKRVLSALIITSLLTCITSINVLAKGGGHSSSHSVSHSTSHTTTSKSTSSGFKSGSFSSSKSSTTKSNTTVTKSKIFSFSKSSTPKTVNVKSKALSNIPISYSSHSVSNNYYYNTSNGGSSFWSNYFLYRALTPEHRVYVTTTGSNEVAPAYTGIRSMLADLTTLIVAIIIICIAIWIFRKRRK